jgi:hypothetical protein
MFRQFRPVTFDPYGRRRSRWSVPRWLVLLLGGIAIGAGGVVYVQESHLPPRLSATASAELRTAFERAEAERLRLKNELALTAKQLAAALDEKKALADDLATSRAATERLRNDVAALVAVLPPDPRGGAIAVRAARFAVKDGMLAYDVVLSRDRAGGKTMAGVMQLVVAGESGRGGASTVNLEPVAIAVGHHESLHGTLRLPDGFQPRQTTIKLLDRLGGQLLGTRVMNVN